MKKTPKTDEQRAAELREKITAQFSTLRKDITEFQASSTTNPNITPSRKRGMSVSTPGMRERDFDKYDREKAMAKAREFHESHPLVAGLITSMCDSIVGSGFRLSMQSGDKTWDDTVVDWWNGHKDKLDVRGLRTWGQLQRVWWTRRFVDGDIGIYKYTVPGTKGQPNQRYLNTIESDRIRYQKYDYLDTGHDTAKLMPPNAWKPMDKKAAEYILNSGKAGSDMIVTIQQGIAYDPNGRMIGAFVGPRPTQQLDWEKILRIGVWIGRDELNLWMNIPESRVDVLRGQSGLMVNFNALQDIVEIIENVLLKIKTQAFIALMLYTEPTAGGTLFPGEKVKKNEDSVPRKTRQMIPATMLDMAPGEKAELLGMNSPNAELMPFLRFIIRLVGCTYGWPLELLLLDVSETNFSGGRLLMELAKHHTQIEQGSLGTVSSDCFLWDAQAAIDSGELRPPKGMKPQNVLKHRWGKPALPYYDPAREAQADGLNLDRYLTSPQAILADRGDMDMDDVLDQNQEWEKACKQRDLTPMRGTVSTTVTEETTTNKTQQKSKEQMP